MWAQAILSQPKAVNPADWRWEKIGKEWKVLWTTNSPSEKVVNSSLSVAASLAVVSGANATGLVSHAQPCAVANLNCSFSVIFDHLIEIMLCFNPGCSGEFRYNLDAVFC